MLKIFIIVNTVLILLAILGSFIINRNADGLFIGMSDLFILWYLKIVFIVALVLNICIMIFYFLNKS